MVTYEAKGAKAGRSKVNGIIGEKDWGRDRVSVGGLRGLLGEIRRGQGLEDASLIPVEWGSLPC